MLEFAIGVVVWALVWAAVIVVLSKLMAGFRPKYWHTYLANLGAVVASFVVGAALGFICGLVGAPKGMGGILGAIASVPTGGYVYGRFLKSADGVPLGFKFGTIISLIITAAGVGVILFLSVVGSLLK